MRIPLATVKPRFYVATSEKHAFSSWDTLDEAIACIGRFSPGTDRDQIQGVVETGPQGRVWVHKETPMKYRIVWDNGASASGEFDIDFDSVEEAEEFGDDWVASMEALDADDDIEDAEEGYSYEVIEKP